MDKTKRARIKLGKLIRQRRENLDINRQELADSLGIAYGTLQAIEAGKHAWNIDTHIRLCDRLKINLQ